MIIDIILLIWVHFVADFVLQTDKMAINKSSSNKWLLYHVVVYTIQFFWFGYIFAIVNGIAHFIVDYITSRATSYLWSKDKRHWFFVVIGLDQALHFTILVSTYSYFIVNN